MKADHERIWLQNAEDAAAIGASREWCSAPVWPDDPEDSEPTEYVRADLVATARAEARKAALEEAASAFEVYASDQRACIAKGWYRGRGIKDAEVRAETWEDAVRELRDAASKIAIRALIEHESKEG